LAHEPRATPKLTDTTRPADPGDESGAAASREQRIARAFVNLADTMVDDFDLTEFLHVLVDHCVDLLEVDAAGVLLSDQRGGVRMAAASSEKAELLEVFAADTDGGPCVECVRTGEAVVSTDVTADAERWPRYAAVAEACGFRAVHALPMRLRRDVIGALSLLNVEPDGVHAMSTQLGQALADVATIGILQQRTIDRASVVTEQLQTALNSRIIIEQAKGMLAAHSGTLTPEQAFTALRGYARTHHHRLSDLARQVIDGTADIKAITTHGNDTTR
jgi:transcriptional regulator with GAF, ATPase, and Fis domain